MTMKRQNSPARLASLLLALALFLTACQSGTSAATMFLQKTGGMVEVSDDEGQSVSLMENLGLYSGYGIDTEAASYA